MKRTFFGDGPHKYANMLCTALWDKYRNRPWDWSTVHETLKFYDDWIGTLEARAFGFPHDPVPDWLPCTYAPNPNARREAAQCQRDFLERWHSCE